MQKQIGNYKIIKLIGEGFFAKVYLAEHVASQKKVAIKAIDNSKIPMNKQNQAANSSSSDESNIDSSSDQSKFIREITLVKKLDHPFIAKLFEVIEDIDTTYLVMEYIENGTLLNYVNNHGRLCEKQARRYLSQLISALEYLHDDCKVAHRDLKPENVILDRYLNLRLIDFGLSNYFSEENPNLTTACGSPAYASPEMILGKTYTKQADVWSAGVLLYAISTGELPFDDDDMQTLLKKIVYTEPIFPRYLSPQLIDLMKRMLDKNPEQRITLSKIKEHPWFSQSEYTRLLQMKFSLEEKWRSNGLDKEIVDELAQKETIDPKKLAESLLLGETDSTTVLYSIYKRDKITEKLGEMMKYLDKPISERMSFANPKSVMARNFRKTCMSPAPRPIPANPKIRVKPTAPSPSGTSRKIPVPPVPQVPKYKIPSVLARTSTIA